MARLRDHRASIVLAMLVTAGAVLIVLSPLDRSQLLAWGEALAAEPAALALLVVLQILLYAFAMPGSLALWLVAPFASLPVAAAVLLAGSLGGALGGYLVAQRMGASARRRLRDKPAFALLARRSDAMTQCALRMLPGFPHAVVNYAGGLLELPLGRYLLAALIGLSIKMTLYVSAVHALLDAGDNDAGLGAWSLLPLVLLALFLVGGRYISRRLSNHLVRRRAQAGAD